MYRFNHRIRRLTALLTLLFFFIFTLGLIASPASAFDEAAVRHPAHNRPTSTPTTTRSRDIVSAAPMTGTLLYDHFGVTLALSSTESAGAGLDGSGGYSFDWNSFVPTKNTDTAEFIEGDWFGTWGSDFSYTTFDHPPAPGTPDLDYISSGGEPYDVEAYYFDNDDDYYYLVIVTSVPHFTSNGIDSDIGVVDTRISGGDYLATVRTGDVSISFGQGVARAEDNGGQWHYNYGVDITQENRDDYGDVNNYARPNMRSTALGTGLYSTSSDAGGSEMTGPDATTGDWYTSAGAPSGSGLISSATPATWEHTNFDPLAAAFSGSFLGDTTTNVYEYTFPGGLEENDFPTYIYEIIIPRALFGTDDLATGESFGFRFTPGCRNDGNGDGDGIISLIGTVDPTPQPAALGNYVWLDENSDGVQDAGEAGIPNVIVNAVDGNGTVYTTTTDSNGGYMFRDLTAGTYTVSIPASNFAGGALDGTVQTPLSTGAAASADFGNKDDAGYTMTLAAGDVNLTADFGYNANGTTDVDSGDGDAAIGDRVWIDLDGDGAQDPAELGVAGVEVTLYSDHDGDGIYDNVVATTTTDANGNYLFDGLTPDAYVVAITGSGSADHNILDSAAYTQTGDPDHFGTTGSNNDNQSAPIVLAPGDVFLNADFGYQPNGGTVLNSIGDTIWMDADVDGDGPSMTAIDNAIAVTQGNGGSADAEPTLANVTVALIADSNNNGTWDAGEPIIASTRTDANGQYLFDGLADGSYLVWVNDTDGILIGLDGTWDADGGELGIAAFDLDSTSSNPSAVDIRDADFGYAPRGHGSSRGLIGDTIWYDTDGEGDHDSDESGIAGVIVTLTDIHGDVMTTTTNANGQYWFGGLDPDGNYTVQVDVTTLPAGVVQTYDPDGSVGNHSIVDLSLTGPINLDQDFGYVAGSDKLGSIGNLVWLDSNADGDVDSGEFGIEGVTLDLYWDKNANGVVDADDPRIGTTTTDNNGAYLFDNLSADNVSYIVDVSDRAGVLAGHWHSLGTVGSNNESHPDPYGVTLDLLAPHVQHVDFGYYVDLAAVGNFVWYDLNANGSQDDGAASALENVAVTMIIEYANGDTIELNTTTDATGHYSFGNLLADEDLNGSDAAPTYTISVGSVPSLAETQADQGSDLTDSDPHSGVVATPVQGQTDTALSNMSDAIASYDFGFADAAAIGDYVWFDADQDGIQDAEEDGIANVLIGLYKDGVLIATQYTNANGGYIFDGLASGNYTVAVIDDLNILDDMTATSGPQVYTGSTIVLEAGDFYVDADFGYAIDPSSNAVLGDTVWYDVDGDGEQDPNELGIEGVVIIITDGTNTYTATTDSQGKYYITLPAGNYTVSVDTSTLPAGLTQTWDYDETLDHSTMVVLNPGDVFLDADFGYTALLGRIGNQIWIDDVADGIYDSADDTPVAGVTVELIHDVNGNGVWDAGEPIINSLTTDTDGQYLFDSLPADEYIVFVSDFNRILAGYAPTQVGPNPADDHNNRAMPHAVSLGSAESYLKADFGFVSTGIVGNPVGAIGNQVWIDLDVDGIYDADSEQGIAGVVIELWQGDSVIATTTTNSEGRYLFNGLAAGTYSVRVADSHGALDGFNLSVYGPNPGQDDNHQAQPYTINLGSGEVNLTGDFGFIYPREATAVTLSVAGAQHSSTPMTLIIVITVMLLILLTSLLTAAWCKRRCN